MLKKFYSKALAQALILGCACGLSVMANAQQITAEDLLSKIRAERANDQNILRDREARFRTIMDDQRKQTAKVKTDHDAADARTKRLDTEFEANRKRVEQLKESLENQKGNLGELFGVTRQVAGDVAATLKGSLIGTQLEADIKPGAEKRVDFMLRISTAKELPNIKDLERMWMEMLNDMKGDSEVARYKVPVLQADGKDPVDTEVVRVGSFMAFGANKFLSYLPSKGMLSVMSRQPDNGELMGNVKALLATQKDSGFVEAPVDPSRGNGLLAVYVERPTTFERINHGEKIVWLTAVVGVLGMVLAIYQYFYLIVTKMSVAEQLKRMAKPMKNNPLGRMMIAVNGPDGHGSDNDRAEVVELKISESVLREIPKLERFQSFLRLAVAAGPLLGLIGTVIGMILTFQSITAAGTSDPKLMADGIGKAMIATVMGLGVAIPLLFVNAGLVTLSRSITHVLEEESTSMMTKKLRQQ